MYSIIFMTIPYKDLTFSVMKELVWDAQAIACGERQRGCQQGCWWQMTHCCPTSSFKCQKWGKDPACLRQGDLRCVAFPFAFETRPPTAFSPPAWCSTLVAHVLNTHADPFFQLSGLWASGYIRACLSCIVCMGLLVEPCIFGLL